MWCGGVVEWEMVVVFRAQECSGCALLREYGCSGLFGCAVLVKAVFEGRSMKIGAGGS